MGESEERPREADLWFSQPHAFVVGPVTLFVGRRYFVEDDEGISFVFA